MGERNQANFQGDDDQRMVFPEWYKDYVSARWRKPITRQNSSLARRKKENPQMPLRVTNPGGQNLSDDGAGLPIQQAYQRSTPPVSIRMPEVVMMNPNVAVDPRERQYQASRPAPTPRQPHPEDDSRRGRTSRRRAESIRSLSGSRIGNYLREGWQKTASIASRDFSRNGDEKDMWDMLGGGGSEKGSVQCKEGDSVWLSDSGDVKSSSKRILNMNGQKDGSYVWEVDQRSNRVRSCFFLFPHLYGCLNTGYVLIFIFVCENSSPKVTSTS